MNNLFAKLSLLLLAGITTNLYAQEPTPTASAQETAAAPAAEEESVTEDASKVDMAAATKIDPTVEAGNEEAAAKTTEATEEKSEESEDSQEDKNPKKATSSKRKKGKKRHGHKHGKHRASASHPKQANRPDIIEALQHRQSNTSCPASIMPSQPTQHVAPSMTCTKGGCSL